MNQPLAAIFRYNKWANLTLIDACRPFPDEHLDARVAGRSGSVRTLLMHIIGGQQTFVLRTQGRQHEGEFNRGSAWPGFDVLQEIATRSSDELIAIAETLDVERDVDLPYFGKVYRFPTSFFLLHALQHGIEHRTEIKVILEHLGIATPDLDGWVYAAAAGFGAEV